MTSYSTVGSNIISKVSSLVVSSSAVSIVDDMVSPPPWGNTIPSLLSLLANIAPKGALSAVGRAVGSDLSLLLYLTYIPCHHCHHSCYQKKRYINIART